MEIIYYYVRGKNWSFGDVPCRLNTFLISLNRAGSIMFLTAMSIDRYFKVVHPHHRVNKMPTSFTVKVTGVLWILAMAICSHLLAEPRTFMYDNLTYCEPFGMTQHLSPTAIWTDIIYIVFNFCLPAPIIVFSTFCIIWKLKQMKTESRGKYKRAVKLVVVVAAVFVVCFLPTNIAAIAVLVTRPIGTEGCQSYEIAVEIFYNTLFMTYLNAVLDPVIYYFSSSIFKDTLMKALASLNLNCFRSTTRRSMQRGEPRGEMVVGQELKRILECNPSDQSQSDITSTAIHSA
ncbi:hydroxycarboxylic acid receptor 2-like [Mustelus asterias]